jgi:lipid-A-disaccharide synthase
MLTLFPFEADFYREQGVAVDFVGHPMADEIEENVDQAQYRRRLDLPESGRIVALLPGSRSSELARHADLFVETAAWLHRRDPSLVFAAPLVDEHNAAVFRSALDRQSTAAPSIRIYAGAARAVMAAADVVLLASGTAALEAALLGRPMVVTYRVTPLSYLLIRFLAHVDVYSMPNHLMARPLVPEFMQSRATAANLGEALWALLHDPAAVEAMRSAFRGIYHTLRCNANERAADAIEDVLREREWNRRQGSA